MQDKSSLRKIPVVSLVFLIFSFLILTLSWGRLPPKVPLYYSLPWGEDQLVSPNELWLLPGGIALTMLINFLISKLFRDEVLLGQIANVVTAIFAFLALFTLIRIILIAI